MLVATAGLERCRLPKEGKEQEAGGTAPAPVLLLHGIGLGLLPYVNLIRCGAEGGVCVPSVCMAGLCVWAADWWRGVLSPQSNILVSGCVCSVYPCYTPGPS